MADSETVLKARPISCAINSQTIIYPERFHQLTNTLIYNNHDHNLRIYATAFAQPDTYPTPTQDQQEASNDFIFAKRSPTVTSESRLSKPSDDALIKKQSAEAASIIKPMTGYNPLLVPPKKRSCPETISLKDDHEHQQKKKIRRKKKNLKVDTEGAPSCVDDNAILASLVDHLKSNMHYTDITDAKIILEKELTNSDTNESQGRLSIPAKQTIPFLTHEEEEYLKVEQGKVGDLKKGKTTMQVKVIMGCSEYNMPLSRWEYNDKQNNNKAGWRYVLKNELGQWNKLKKENGLQAGDIIRLVSFRSNNYLHFAILKRKIHTLRLFGKSIVVYDYRME